MKKILFTLVCTCLCNQLSLAETAATKNGTPIDQKYGYSFAYYGASADKLGAQLGVEKYLATTENFQVFWSSYFQFQNQKDLKTSVALNSRIGQRFTTDYGLMLDSQIGVGIQQTYYSVTQYELTQNVIEPTTSTVKKMSALPNIALGMGYDFSKKKMWPVIGFVRANISWTIPDINLVFNTTSNLEAGIIYKR